MERKLGMFRENMSTRDRDIRLMLVAPLAVLALFFLHGIWTIIVGGIGLIFLATSALGYCPIYQLLGIGRNIASQANVPEETMSHQH
jgi:hypothetical protein